MVDWTAIAVSIFGAGGVATAIITSIGARKKDSLSRREETEALASTSTPVTGGSADRDIVKIAQDAQRQAGLAMDQIANLNTRLGSTEARLQEVEGKFNNLREYYRRLRRWTRHVVENWDEIRHHSRPPEPPEDTSL